MPGPSIPWKTLETEAWRTQIDGVPPARYKLASPRTITGSPSFAMESADQHCVVRVYIGAGEAPDLSLTVSGTTPVPMTNAVGGNLTAQELADLRIEVGMPQPGFTLLTTDEPNGSPSAPFATEADVYAAYPLPNALPDGFRIYIINPAVPSGVSMLEIKRGNPKYWGPPAGELIAGGCGVGSEPFAKLESGLVTKQTVGFSEVIADLLIVPNTIYRAMCEMEIACPGGGAGGSQLAYNIGGVAGDPSSAQNIAENGGLTASAAGTYPPWFNTRFFQFNGTDFVGPSGQAPISTTPGSSGLRSTVIGTPAPGGTRVWFTTKPQEAADIVRVWSFAIYAAT